MTRGHPTAYRWVLVAASFLFMLAFWGAQSSFSVFIGPLSEEFGGSRGMVSLAYTFNLIASAGVGVVMGVLADRKGPRLAAILCGVFMGSGFLLASRAAHLWQLYLTIGVLGGLGMAGGFIVPTVTISKWFQTQRGLALGLAFTSIGIAYMLGPPWAGYLIANFGWRTAYVIIGTGSLFLALSMTPLFRLPGGPSGEGLGPYSAPASGPSLRQALRGSSFWVVFLVWGLQGFSIIAVTTHLVPFATDQGISLARAASLFTTYGVATTVARSAFGGLADRFGTKPVFSLCVVLQAVALLGFLLGGGLVQFYVAAALLGLGASGGDTVITREAPELFGTAALGAIMGAVVIGWRVGAAVGSPFAGFIYDVTSAYTLALWVAFVFVAGAGPLFLLGLRRRPQDAGKPAA
ncbi:MAG: MFS transporter [Chloroflexi bacterium]|nr:MFS transporter [Chloroflexota bacterium]